MKYPKKTFLAVSSKRTYNVINPSPPIKNHKNEKRKKAQQHSSQKTVKDCGWWITVHLTTRQVHTFVTVFSYSTWAPKHHCFNGVSGAQYLVFYAVFFVLSFICLSVLPQNMSVSFQIMSFSLNVPLVHMYFGVLF